MNTDRMILVVVVTVFCWTFFAAQATELQSGDHSPCMLCNEDLGEVMTTPDATFYNVYVEQTMTCMESDTLYGQNGAYSTLQCLLLSSEHAKSTCGCLVPTVETEPASLFLQAIEQEEDLALFAKLLRQTNLADDFFDRVEPLTFFAPVMYHDGDDANDELETSKYVQEPSWGLHLQELLLYHATTHSSSETTDTAYFEKDLETHTSLLMTNSEPIRVQRSSSSLSQQHVTIQVFNDHGNATLIETDLSLPNGVMHKIDTVLYPTSWVTHLRWNIRRLSSLSSHLGLFDTFLELVELAGIRDYFETQDMTLFLPLDEAFDAVPPAVMKALTDDNDDARFLLERVLLNHVVETGDPFSLSTPIVIYPSFALENDMVLTTADGNTITVHYVTEGDDQQQHYYEFNQVPAVQMDAILAKNGIAHIIHGTLIPEDILEQLTANSNAIATAAPSVVSSREKNVDKEGNRKRKNNSDGYNFDAAGITILALIVLFGAVLMGVSTVVGLRAYKQGKWEFWKAAASAPVASTSS